MVALMTLYGLLWAAGGNDILAIMFHLNLNYITYFMRVAVFVGPVLAFLITRAGASRSSARTRPGCCTATRPASSCAPPRARTPSGTCRSAATRRYTLTARDRDEVVPMPTEEDENGVATARSRSMRLRARLSQLLVRQQHPEADRVRSSRRPGSTPSTSSRCTTTATSTCRR